MLTVKREQLAQLAPDLWAAPWTVTSVLSSETREVVAALRTSCNEGAAHDFVRELSIKFIAAVDAGDVLGLFLGRYIASSGDMDLLSDSTVRTLNRYLISTDSCNAVQCGNQMCTGFGFGYEAVRPGFGSCLKSRTIMNRQEHDLS